MWIRISLMHQLTSIEESVSVRGYRFLIGLVKNKYPDPTWKRKITNFKKSSPSPLYFLYSKNLIILLCMKLLFVRLNHSVISIFKNIILWGMGIVNFYESFPCWFFADPRGQTDTNPDPRHWTGVYNYFFNKIPLITVYI